MFRLLSILLLAAIASPAQMLQMGEASQGFVSLFTGHDLGRWEGDERLWKAERGVLTGSTEGVDPIKTNQFLIYKGGQFKDFELRLEIKLRNHNSGIQFRSEELPGYVVKGLQADAAEGNWWGSVYDEKGTRGVIVNGWTGKAEKIVKANDWNDYFIYCKGGTVRLTVNGMVTSELTNETPKEGILALQLHAGPPMQVQFRNIRIKKLD